MNKWGILGLLAHITTQKSIVNTAHIELGTENQGYWTTFYVTNLNIHYLQHKVSFITYTKSIWKMLKLLPILLQNVYKLMWQ
jgi:hypothetical protein